MPQRKFWQCPGGTTFVLLSLTYDENNLEPAPDLNQATIGNIQELINIVERDVYYSSE